MGKHAALRALFGLAGLIAIVVLACGDGDGATSDTGDAATPPTEGGAPSDAATDSGPQRAPFGLDARPPNPTCKAGPRPTGTADFELVDVTPNLLGKNYTVQAIMAPGDPSRWFIVTQDGSIWSFPSDGSAFDPSLVLKLPPDKVRFVGEAGLLGLAFDPNWMVNRTAYISYNGGPAGDTGVVDKSYLSRIKSTDNGQTLSLATEEVLLAVDQPGFINHKGGLLAFGADGYLYWGLGDGGDANDPFDNGQNKNTLLGKMLRIKVGPTGPYTIPPDNPLAAGGGKPELFAWGLRNPWRWSFDRATGDLWVGDVGQNIWEEVDIIQKGGNYGWKIREAAHCRYPTVEPCDGDGSLIDPVYEYEHLSGFTGPGAVIGGYVYRGTQVPELVGKYVFSDITLAEVYVLDFDPISGKPTSTKFADSTVVASFAEDLAGEVYGVGFGDSHLLKVRKKQSTQTVTFPSKLSETGCFDKADPRKALPMMIPYEINVPFWSDGADKSRWVALPDDEKMNVRPDGDIDFPKGTVLAKEFRVGGKRVETRLFVKHDDEWGGYSYEWNEAETEATLLASGKTRKIGSLTWTFPSRSQCMQCHSSAAGRSLGLETPQLVRDVVYASTNRVAPQIDTLEHIGLLANVAAAKSLTAWPDPFGTAPVDQRARAYLSSNCSHCHRPGGLGGGGLNLRFEASLADTKTCNRDPSAGTLGIAGAKLLAPGDPSRSVLLARMKSTEAYKMPPLARTTEDTKGVSVIANWISGISSCPP
ncbi:MAG: PQQ-dependent sugar dehydrogenase [Rubrivivax sp.]